jgi:hypothetical protein
MRQCEKVTAARVERGMAAINDDLARIMHEGGFAVPAGSRAASCGCPDMMMLPA